MLTDFVMPGDLANGNGERGNYDDYQACPHQGRILMFAHLRIPDVYYHAYGYDAIDNPKYHVDMPNFVRIIMDLLNFLMLFSCIRFLQFPQVACNELLLICTIALVFILKKTVHSLN